MSICGSDLTPAKAIVSIDIQYSPPSPLFQCGTVNNRAAKFFVMQAAGSVGVKVNLALCRNFSNSQVALNRHQYGMHFGVNLDWETASVREAGRRKDKKHARLSQNILLRSHLVSDENLFARNSTNGCLPSFLFSEMVYPMPHASSAIHRLS